MRRRCGRTQARHAHAMSNTQTQRKGADRRSDQSAHCRPLPSPPVCLADAAAASLCRLFSWSLTLQIVVCVCVCILSLWLRWKSVDRKQVRVGGVGAERRRGRRTAAATGRGRRRTAAAGVRACAAAPTATQSTAQHARTHSTARAPTHIATAHLTSSQTTFAAARTVSPWPETQRKEANRHQQTPLMPVRNSLNMMSMPMSMRNSRVTDWVGFCLRFALSVF